MSSHDSHATTVFDSRPAVFPDALDVRPLTTLGRPGSGLTLNSGPKVERDGSGRFYVITHRENEPLSVCEADGRVVGTIGRYGHEFHGFIHDIHVAPDGWLVALHDHYFGSVFDPEGEWTRGLKLVGSPHHPKLVGMREQHILVAVGNPALPPPRHPRVASEPPLQLYDENGRLERSFGPHHFIVPWGARQASWAADGSVWLWGPGYRLERCDLHGDVDRVIGVEGPASWYTDWSPRLFMTKEDFLANQAAHRSSERPKPFPPKEPFVVTPRPFPVEVSRVRQVDDSHLLVAAHVFHPGTESDPLPRLVVDPTAGCCPRGPDWEQLDFQFRSRNTVLDLIEIATGDVRARAEIPGRCHLASDGTLWRPVVRDETVQVETFEVALPRSQ